MASSITVGVDVGGTFTDVVALDNQTGEIRVTKHPTQTDNPAAGVVSAVAALGWPLDRANLLIHGTTITTNAVLERRLPRTGLITTKGFRDVLELGRRTRPHAYGLKGGFVPVIPRDLRLEVLERIMADGSVLEELDLDALRAAARTILDAGCVSVAVHFLHSCTNPAHELAAETALREIWPNGNITLGHRLVPEVREYERGVTAAVNASVQPILARYVERLGNGLREAGYQREFLLMNGNGGTVTASLAPPEAARTVMSGPASGVIAAAQLAKRSGFSHLLTCDMGGTSTDVALVENGRPMVSSEIEIDYAMPIHLPMVDVRTIGAGGGSILHVDPAGLLQIGPESAGAYPGPIAFGRGGTRPTITDANILVGRLDPEALLGVEAPVSREDIAKAFERELCGPLGMDPYAVAESALKVANLKMAGAIRLISVDRGKDPRDFSLMAFGGGGPLHASAIAAELGVPRVVVAPRPGIANAVGCLIADLRHETVRTINQPLAACREDDLETLLAEQEAAGREAIAREMVTPERIEVERSLDMKFIGQTHILRIPLPDGAISLPEIDRHFAEAYWKRFQVRLPEIKAMITSATTTVNGIRPASDLSAMLPRDSRAATVEAARVGTRRLRIGGDWVDVAVYDRPSLPGDALIEGPAILTQLDTTIILEPGDRAEMDPYDNLLIHKSRGAA